MAVRYQEPEPAGQNPGYAAGKGIRAALCGGGDRPVHPLILGRWRAVFFFIPIETVIHNRQEEYYRALRRSDSEGSSTLFVEFMLSAILAACEELSTPEAAPEVTPEVQRLVDVLDGEMNRREIQDRLGLKAEKNFRLLYLRPALDMGLIEMTIPDKPRSPRQCYRLTLAGQAVKKKGKGAGGG